MLKKIMVLVSMSLLLLVGACGKDKKSWKYKFDLC